MLDTAGHSTVFDHYRVRLILSRVRLMAALFAVLVLLWIPLDMWVFPRPVWQLLALGRIAASGGFAMLALYCCRASTFKRIHVAVFALFFIPSVFFLFSHVVLWGVALSRIGATMASGYAFLPFVMVAGISIFPLTVLELAVLALPLLAVAGIPVMEGHAFMMPTFNATAVLWLLALVAAVGSLSAVSQLQLQRTLFARSVIDPLIGLLNRRGLQEVLDREHARAQRHHEPYSLCLVDLDYFKLVNDGYGHEVGDRALTQVGETIRQALRADDWAGRWGGDEFLCLLPETDLRAAWPVVERLRHHIDALKFTADGHPIPLTASIGFASFPHDGEQLDTLLAHIDSALYQAKNYGRNKVVHAGRRTPEVFFIGRQIEEALAQGRIQPAYQPIVALTSGRVVAEEALARLRRPDGSVLAAAEFIGAAEALQLVHRIDTAIFRQVLTRCIAQPQSSSPPRLQFINASVDVLRHATRVNEWLESARQGYAACGGCLTAGDKKSLVIEITERGLLDDPQEIVRVLQPLLAFGIQLAVDDFGSGYSSFLYLADLPVSFLKIEMRLVQRARHEGRILAMLKGLQHIARDLGLTTIAEGIEDEATAHLVREVGIDWGQGYYFGRPVLSSGAEAAVRIPGGG
ncbi:MAG: bifunctional diguanylate cyclase/phosphodiesterase [Gammaproteobacteria bacterium]|nr:bifunctional diguanylate cyclase/phosphodiesterase [Gammaproteobacteria bacterium]